MSTTATTAEREMNFVDLFAGCGGLSLGLMNAGWNGLFAIERDQNAFMTLKHNLIDGDRPKFEWPSWMQQSPWEVGHFTQTHRENLAKLKGRVKLIAGGPPCQGFSFAGRRKHDDPRNVMVDHYLEIVRLLQPDALLIENVRGIAVGFQERGSEAAKIRSLRQKSAADRIKELLEAEGYCIFADIYFAKDFGVPQQRPRFVIIGIKARLLLPTFGKEDWHERLERSKSEFLKKAGLSGEVPALEALSDLAGTDTEECVDSHGFKQICYTRPGTTKYQRLLRKGFSGAPNSLRLAKHRPETVRNFQRIQESDSKGKVPADLLTRIGTKKRSVCWLDESKPAPTLTTLPDDLLHYKHPRILTVRECARLQSFPDWFAFQGKYTTGGKLRTQEAPRYSQVGNAVPPFMAQVFGSCIAGILAEAKALKKSGIREVCSGAA